MQKQFIKELQELLPHIPELLNHPDAWNTLLIEKHEPIIYRLSYKISENRNILLQRVSKMLNPVKEAYMHSHSWPFALQLLKGSYEMGVGFSHHREAVPKPTFFTTVNEGDVYSITDENTWHYTKPISPSTYSVMLIGPRVRERMAVNTKPLPAEFKATLVDNFKQFLDERF